MDTVSIFFLKDITRGEKDVRVPFLTLQYIKRSAVKVAAVPQIEGLKVEDFLKHARKKPALMRYLPDEKDWNHIDKKWVCDVLYTKDQEGIQSMRLWQEEEAREEPRPDDRHEARVYTRTLEVR